MNLADIADGLAARFAPGVVTPPTGMKNITSATARPPNNIPNTPFVIAWASDGDVKLAGFQVDHTLRFNVVFYFSKSDGDIPRQYDALLEWVGILIDQLYAQQKLGVTGVKKGYVTRWEIGVLTYAGTLYEAVSMAVTVDLDTEHIRFTP